MPLHDWTDRSGWEGMHIYWMTEIARDLKARLPAGYRAVIGSHPLVAIGLSPMKPDVAVTNGVTHPTVESFGAASSREPDIEIAVATLEEDATVCVERDGRLVAAIEVLSPRNRCRMAAREQYAGRYMNTIRGGVHLMIVDVHRRPIGFSFPQLVAATFGETLPAAAAPTVVSYRVGAPAAQGGRMLAVWQEVLGIGKTLPSMPLPLGLDLIVNVDLESTYSQAASDSYVD